MGERRERKVAHAKTRRREGVLQRLSDVAELIMGQSPPSTSYNDSGDGIPFYQGKSDFGFRHPRPRLFCNEPIKKARTGDILISVRAPVGPTNIADKECCIGRGLGAIRPKDIDGEYLYFNLRFIEQHIASLGSGTTFQSINKAQLGDVEINTAGYSLCEQREIAAILGQVQKAIEEQERLLALTEELKRTLLHRLFTQGLRGELQKQTEIGPVPESWGLCKIGDVAKIQSGGTPSRDNPAFWQEGSIPWVKTGEIDYCVIRDTEEKITPKGLTDSATRLFPAGTLLMAMYGQGITRGRVALLDIDAATNQACAAIMPHDEKKVSSRFLYYFFEYHYEDLRKLGHGANQRNMNAALIRSFQLAFPSAEEQAEIVASLSALDAKQDSHHRKHATLSALFTSLLHQLMTRQITCDKTDQRLEMPL